MELGNQITLHILSFLTYFISLNTICNMATLSKGTILTNLVTPFPWDFIYQKYDALNPTFQNFWKKRYPLNRSINIIIYILNVFIRKELSLFLGSCKLEVKERLCPSPLHYDEIYDKDKFNLFYILKINIYSIENVFAPKHLF